MKHYMLAVQHDFGKPLPPDMERLYAQTGAVNEEMQKAGVWVFGGGLVSPESATVIRYDGGSTTMTDGPFAETKEQLGGFWVIQCADLDEALEWGRRCATACEEPVEVRPFDGLTG